MTSLFKLFHLKVLNAQSIVDCIQSGSIVVCALPVDSALGIELVLHSTASSMELERAARYRFKQNRSEFLLARGVVRDVMSVILGIPAADVEIVAPANQKPEVIQSPNVQIDVSISHSLGWVACAFAQRRRVGIDIEIDRNNVDNDALISHVCSDYECQLYKRLASPMRRELFYEIWRHKEAVLKANGLGLAGDITSFNILNSDDHGELYIATSVVVNGDQWQLYSGSIDSGPTVAVAYSA